MAVKSAQEKIQDLKVFIPNAKIAIAQFEEFLGKMEADASFRRLWETDSAAALRTVGINPDSRMEMGYEEYAQGPECNNCITPLGNACHC